MSETTTTAEVEEVLVVSRRLLQEVLPVVARVDPQAVGYFHPAECQELDALCAEATFMNRALAENDVGFKQLIVYALISHEGKTLCYKRGKVGSEPRLHAKHSVGVGGHINPVDWACVPVSGGGSDKCLMALVRELEEEVGIKTPDIHHVNFMGFVNEDATAVGQVHLGLVYEVVLNSTEGLAFEEALVAPEWLTDLDRRVYAESDRFELWSRIIVDSLDSRVVLAPHQLRVVEEKKELDERRTKLREFIRDNPTFTKLPDEDQFLLCEQERVMYDLAAVLDKRIARF